MILVIGASFEQTNRHRLTILGEATRHVPDAITLGNAITANRHHPADTQPLTVHLLDGWSYARTDAQAGAILDVLTATGTEWVHVEATDA